MPFQVIFTSVSIIKTFIKNLLHNFTYRTYAEQRTCDDINFSKSQWTNENENGVLSPGCQLMFCASLKLFAKESLTQRSKKIHKT